MFKNLKVFSYLLVLLFLTGTTFAEMKEKKAVIDIKKGKALFNDPKLGGGTTGKSCNSCHPDGKGLENSADKKEIILMGNKLKNIEEAVNMCIKNPMKGKGLDLKSADMTDLTAYLKPLKKPVEELEKTEDKKSDKPEEKAW